jgi:peroxiredoxin
MYTSGSDFTLGSPAPHFTLRDHSRAARTLTDLCGERGVVLGFTGDIWRPASVRRIIWLQRHAAMLQRTGFQVALLIQDEPHMVYGFYASSPTPPPFPMLADAERAVHRLFGMEEEAGMVIIDHEFIMRHRWLLTADRIWPRLPEILEALEMVGAGAAG